MDRILDLMTSEETATLFQRQEEEIQSFLLSRKNEGRGFSISEFATLERIIILCLERIEEDGTFEETLARILILCQLPFVQQSANEKFRNPEVLCSFLHTLSTLLICNSNVIKICAANALHEFVKNRKLMAEDAAENQKRRKHNEGEDILDQRPDEWTYHQYLFKKSGAMELVSEAVRTEVEHLFGNDVDGDGRISAAEYDRAYGILPGDENPQPQVSTVSLMKLVCELACYRDNAMSLCREQVPVLLVKVVSQLLDFRKEEIKLMIQILWSVLEHSCERIDCSQVSSNRMQLLDKFRHANALFSLGNTDTIGMLRSLLERMLVEGFKNSDKELRNEVLIISSLLAKRNGNLDFFHETGFLSLLLLYGSASESELPTGCDDRHFATSEAFDLEMKVLIWYLVERLSHSSGNLAMICESLFVESVLFYIDPAARQHPVRAKWSPQQLRALQMHSLNILGALVQHLSERFTSANGLIIVVQFLVEDHPLQQQDQIDTDLVRGALNLTLQMVFCAKDSLSDSSGSELIKALLMYTNAQDIQIRCIAILILSLLCTKENPHFLSEFRKGKGIKTMCSAFLLIDRSDFLFSDSVLMAALTCVHNCVISCRKSLVKFLMYDGISLLLNLVESYDCSVSVQGRIASILSDIVSLDFDNSFPYVRKWRSNQSGRNAVSLLIDIWIQYSKELSQGTKHIRLYNNEIENTTDLIIQDHDTPLKRVINPGSLNKNLDDRQKGSKKVDQLYEAIRAAQSIMVPTEDQMVMENQGKIDLRDRIYSLLAVIEHEIHEGSDIWKSLNRDQRTAWQLARNYAQLVRGEQWQVVQHMLNDMSLKPVFYDQAILESEREKARELASAVQQKQEVEQMLKHQDEAKSEAQFFGTILDKRDQEIQARMVKKQVSFMKRRLEQKEKQKEMMKRTSQVQHPFQR